MKSNSMKTLLAIILAPSFIAASSFGAVITWTSPASVNPATVNQVDTSGTLVVAEFMNTLSTATVNINGVPFVDFQVATHVTNPSVIGNANLGGGTGTYASLLNGGMYVGDSNSPTNPIVFTGLNPGQTYLVQVWTPYWNSATFTTRVSSSAPTGPSFDHAVDESGTMALGTGSTQPQFVIGSFTLGAGETTQNLYFFGEGTVGLLGAVQLRAVPEPQTWALAALGVSAVLFRLRRKQSAV